jgi:sugar phosphate isomerase/epimerase
MKIALCNVTIAALSFERQCEMAAELGYDGLEIAPVSLDPDPHLLSADKRAALRRGASNAGAAATTETESIPDLIRRWLPTGLIAHVHLNDPNRRGPGEGDLAFAPIFVALREQNYAGNFGVEPFVYKPDGPTCAARAIGYVRGVIEALPPMSPSPKIQAMRGVT